MSELFLVLDFKSTYSVPLLNLVYRTDQQEAANFIESFWGSEVLLVLLLVLILSGGYIYVLMKKRPIQKLLLKIPYLNLFLSLSVMGGIFLFCYRMFSPFTFYKTITPIHRLLVSGKGVVDGIREQKTINEYRKSHVVRLTKEGDKIKNVVFVIGESLNRDHMSLYGYPLKTTPALDLLRGNIFKYEDVISSSPSTFISINNMFSFAGNDPSSSGLWYQKGLLPDIMKAAGYRTYWISNQTTPLLSDDICDVVVYRDKEVAEELKDGLYDEQLLPILKDSINPSDNMRFVVVHLWGSHFTYKKRYPSEYSVFSAKNEIKGKTEEQKQCIAEYDNSVLYNDYIVSSIIRFFQEEESLIIYVSDHGEEVYDFRNFAGRYPDKVTRYMLEIPMLVYVSDSLKNRYPGLSSRIVKSLDRPYMTDDIIHTILDLTGIHTFYYDSTKSVVNDCYDETRTRLVNGVDYDAYLKGSNREWRGL
ncbi:phosphoethanolamine transferase [Parabacteroides sp. ASD2025]|uniref:phosphoethanolamine transferase n=1 Tax=Parabacteroides sp. ASD2025 TaxID=3415987 RepID=UPI003CE985B5